MSRIIRTGHRDFIPMDLQPIAKLLIAVGVVLVAAGVLLYFGGKVNFLGLGRLPGDIRVERDNFRFYFPLATCILISLVLSALMYLLSRWR